MKGYLSFILVFVSAFLILNLVQASEQASKVSFSKAIAAERTYQYGMNGKEAAVEAIRQGALSSFNDYDKNYIYAECGLPPAYVNNQKCFRPDEAKLWTKAGAYLSLVQLSNTKFSDDVDVKISCVPSITRVVANQFVSQDICLGCQNFSTSAQNLTELIALINATGPLPCMDVVSPIVEPIPGNINTNPSLNGVTLSGSQMIVVVVHDKKFDITSVSYIPAGYEVYP